MELEYKLVGNFPEFKNSLHRNIRIPNEGIDDNDAFFILRLRRDI